MKWWSWFSLPFTIYVIIGTSPYCGPYLHPFTGNISMRMFDTSHNQYCSHKDIYENCNCIRVCKHFQQWPVMTMIIFTASQGNSCTNKEQINCVLLFGIKQFSNVWFFSFVRGITWSQLCNRPYRYYLQQLLYVCRQMIYFCALWNENLFHNGITLVICKN